MSNHYLYYHWVRYIIIIYGSNHYLYYHWVRYIIIIYGSNRDGLRIELTKRTS